MENIKEAASFMYSIGNLREGIRGKSREQWRGAFVCPFWKLWTEQDFARMDMSVEDEILLSIDTSIYSSCEA